MAPLSGAVSTLDRLIRILEAFDAEHPSLTTAELAQRAGLPTATAYRWVERLTESDLLERDGGRVRPGLRLWELASRSAPSVSLRQAAMPFLDDVHAVLRQHVQLAVLDDEGVLVLERLSARGAVANQATVAGRLPTFTTSLGQVLLAFSARPRVAAYVRAHAAELGGPVPPTKGSAAPAVNPTEDELRSILAHVRCQGHAAVVGRIDAEARGVSVPVRDGAGRTVAALGVVVPRRMAADAAIAPLLMTAARGIGRSLGEGAGGGEGRFR